ncbi:histidine phosphatase family protein [Cytobacillus horneckiae]|uniref:histidine phosphatase family protein n=1 Tax=Cytobacillus horneckiae TaxID=549687 RepID=UPI00399FE4DE
MEKQIILIRHCEAEGQEPHAPLTRNGENQSLLLSKLLSEHKVDKIISSPFKRAIKTIEHFSNVSGINIEIDSRLSERILSASPLTNWQELLEHSFKDLDLKLEGGESSREAMKRIGAVIDEALASDSEHILVVTHGNILSLLLKTYDQNIGYGNWKGLSNPDVYQLQYKEANVRLKRIWGKNNDEL